MLRTVLPVALLVPLLAACSGSSDDGPSGDSGPSVDPEVRSGLAALYAGDHPGEQDTRNGECFADELLDRVNLRDLEAAGVVVDGAVAPTSPELEPELAEVWVDAMFSCMDFIDESARAQVAFTKGKVDWEQYAACLREDLDDDTVRAAVVGMLTGAWDSPDVAALTRAQADCSTEANPG